MAGILNHIQSLGRISLDFLQSIGRMSFFALRAIMHIFLPPFYARQFLRALGSIGFLSLPVVGLTAIFTGGALILQIYTGGSDLSAEAAAPFIATLGIVRELGPVLAGLMVAGRVASSIASEIATMRVSEQIDALYVLGTHPLKYLIAPRILASILCVPILVAIADILGIFGGFIVGVTRLDFVPAEYLHDAFEHIGFWDVGSGLVKAAAFGLVLALSGSYYGYHASEGAQGVGRATTNAVVTASLLILAVNYALTELFFQS